MREKREVICLDTGQRYPDKQAAAKAAGCTEGSMGGVLAPSGQAKRATVGGKHWAWADAAAPAVKRAYMRKAVPQAKPVTASSPISLAPTGRPSDALVADERARLTPSISAAISAFTLGMAGLGEAREVKLQLKTRGLDVQIEIERMKVSVTELPVE